ncbi:MAG: hypothetical protein ACRD5Z_21125 [Bryobacteraceae bacterium]
MPPYAEAASLVHDAWNGGIERDRALARVATVVGSIGGTRNAALLDVAVKRTILARPTGVPAGQAVIEAYLNAEVDAELMAKVRPAILETDRLDPVSIEKTIALWMQECQRPIRQIAQQVLEGPQRGAFRAPPSRRRVRKETAEILDEAV